MIGSKPIQVMKKLDARAKPTHAERAIWLREVEQVRLTGSGLIESAVYSNLSYRPARPSDAAHLGPRLRAVDAAEIWSMSGLGATAGLKVSLGYAKECWVGVADGRVEAMFGITHAAQRPAFGLIWLLASEQALRFPRAFLRDGTEWLRYLASPYRVIGNLVAAENTEAIRWLRWLGFDFLQLRTDIAKDRRAFWHFSLTLRVNQNGGGVE